MLVQQVAKRAARGVIRDVEAPLSERASRSESEPDSASLRKWRAASPPESGEARRRWRSNEHKQPSGLPGWLGTARADRSIEEPGRPGEARVMASTDGGKT